MKRTNVLSLSTVFFFLFLTVMVFPVISASAASRVGVVNLQQVLDKSRVGMAATKKMEARMQQFKTSLERDKKTILALQRNMKKKADVWNEATKKEKFLELQRKKRDFRMKQDDANLEMKTLQEKYLAPIMKKLEVVVQDVARSKGISVMLPNTAVLYSDRSVDMTDEVTRALNRKR